MLLLSSKDITSMLYSKLLQMDRLHNTDAFRDELAIAVVFAWDNNFVMDTFTLFWYLL